MNLNYEVFQWINSFAGKSSAMDSVMVMITNSVPYFIMACLLLLWFSGKTERTIYHRYTALYMLFTIVLSLCINEVIHLVYYHPRPFVTHHVHKLIPHPANSSFVSDHSILVFSLCLDHVVTKKQMEKRHFYMGCHLRSFTHLRRCPLSSRCTWRHGNCGSYQSLCYLSFR